MTRNKDIALEPTWVAIDIAKRSPSENLLDVANVVVWKRQASMNGFTELDRFFATLTAAIKVLL